MRALPLVYERGGVYVPELDLWLDPRRAQKGPARVCVSHAHSDHTAAHREIIATSPTRRFLEVRLGGQRRFQELAFGQSGHYKFGGTPFALTLLPAGHILGSAMVYLEWKNGSILYTGDFKLRPGRTTEPCTPCAADILVMETTFGHPRYRFPAESAVRTEIVAFCRSALAEGAIPILFAYALGKSQELLHLFHETDLMVHVEERVERITRIYERFGVSFPPYSAWNGEFEGPAVVIAPPGTRRPQDRGGTRKTRTAAVTGWAMDSSCRYRYGTDAAFPLSDHADHGDLLRFVEQVAPKKVFTVHGFAARFAELLRSRGVDALALSEPDQLTFAF